MIVTRDVEARGAAPRERHRASDGAVVRAHPDPQVTSEPACFEGELETHLTVAHDSETSVARLSEWAAARGLGFTHIVLARGRHRSQPMVTLRGHGRADAWLAGPVARTATDLAAAGFAVARAKTEAAPWATGVPQDDAAARQAVPHLHFEHHVKLLLTRNADLDALARRVTRHTAHLSWNARRTRADGHQERFVTQRCHEVGRATAERRLDGLLADLAMTPGARILETEREYVLHDTHLGLDAGWIDTRASTARSDGVLS
ncbi:hypothetical protein ACFC4G_09705 [Streptomyces sp. NPDC056002]|uniref:hypothetical protein n=1 Tax=Streptomyces sp. NPDC056002 TaxID=3345675 RepID=UPI0035D54315